MNAPKVPRIVALSKSVHGSPCSPRNVSRQLFPPASVDEALFPQPRLHAVTQNELTSIRQTAGQGHAGSSLDMDSVLPFHVCLRGREVVIGVYTGSDHALTVGQAAPSTPPSLHCLLRNVWQSLHEFIQMFGGLEPK